MRLASYHDRSFRGYVIHLLILDQWDKTSSREAGSRINPHGSTVIGVPKLCLLIKPEEKVRSWSSCHCSFTCEPKTMSSWSIGPGIWTSCGQIMKINPHQLAISIYVFHAKIHQSHQCAKGILVPVGKLKEGLKWTNGRRQQNSWKRRDETHLLSHIFYSFSCFSTFFSRFCHQGFIYKSHRLWLAAVHTGMCPL